MISSPSSSSSPAAASTSARAPGTGATPSTSRATTATRSSRSSFLEVSPQRAERGERGNPGGLGAQHARAESRRHEARLRQRSLLLGTEARFRPGGDGELLPGLAGGRKAQFRLRREQYLHFARSAVIERRQRRMHGRDTIADALLAGV